MSKQQIEEYIPLAYDALRECGIVKEDDTVDRALRGQIASFGAAVTMGSLLSAIAFFNKASSKSDGSKTDRQLLMKTIHAILLMSDNAAKPEAEREDKFEVAKKASGKDLCIKIKDLPRSQRDGYRERVMDAAVAIKLAMNLYDLGLDKKKEPDGGDHANS